MPALASLEDLKATQKQIQDLKNQYPEAVKAVAALLKQNRRIGYKNICRMLTGEMTPEELKQVSSPGLMGSHPTIDQF